MTPCLRMLCVGLLVAGGLLAQQYVVSTVAGGAAPPSPAVASTSSVGNTNSVATDTAGNFYFSGDQCVFKVDTTGKLTIGFGRNLDDVGLSQDEALYLLTNDINRTITRLALLCPWWNDLDPARQLAIADMAYNLGAGGILEFPRMIEAIKSQDWPMAAQEMMASLWAQQVGQRANRLAQIMASGLL